MEKMDCSEGSCVCGVLSGTNVQCKGELFYTEDRILVHNLYVSRLPKNANEGAVKRLFSTYGDVLSVNMREKKTTRGRFNFRYCFVNFKDAKSAAKALRNQHHFMDTHRITVKAADSWKQPGMMKDTERLVDKLVENEHNSEENIIEENSILRLNDDCLLHIFSFLSINEQLKLSALCERFQGIFEMIFRRKKSLNLYASGNLTLMEVRQIIIQVGHHIQEAHLEDYGDHVATNHSRSLEFIAQTCVNLHWLELSCVSNVHPDTYRRICNNLKNLTKVELKNCSITDQICNHLSRLPVLNTLDISENYELTGRFLSKLPSLTRLNLSQCANIQSKYFSELCKMGKLKSLNIKRCDRLTKSNFEEMENLLESLEELVVSSSYSTEDLYHIAGLENLKDLTIYCSQGLRDNLFDHLAKKQAHNLETLVLIASSLNESKKEFICSLIGLKKLGILRDPHMDDSFLEKIAKLPNLTSLNLAGCEAISRTGLAALFQRSNNLQNVDVSCCHQILPEAIYDIVEQIKKTQRITPCTLYIGNTSIPKNILTDQKYLQCASLLSLSFKICEFGVSFELLDEDDEYLSDEEFFDDIDNFYDSDEDDDDFDFDALQYADEEWTSEMSDQSNMSVTSEQSEISQQSEMWDQSGMSEELSMWDDSEETNSVEESEDSEASKKTEEETGWEMEEEEMVSEEEVVMEHEHEEEEEEEEEGEAMEYEYEEEEEESIGEIFQEDEEYETVTEEEEF